MVCWILNLLHIDNWFVNVMVGANLCQFKLTTTIVVPSQLYYSGFQLRIHPLRGEQKQAHPSSIGRANIFQESQQTIINGVQICSHIHKLLVDICHHLVYEFAFFIVWSHPLVPTAAELRIPMNIRTIQSDPKIISVPRIFNMWKSMTSPPPLRKLKNREHWAIINLWCDKRI